MSEISLLEKAERAHKEGQGRLAHEILTEFLRAEPDNQRALMDLAVVCHGLGLAAEAVSTFERILRLDENHLEARRSLAVALIAQNRRLEADEHLAFILERRPEDHALWFFRARAAADDRRDEARAHLEKALELAPRQEAYVDFRAVLAGLPKPSQTGKKPRLVICCAPGMDNFIHGLLKDLSPYIRGTASVSAQPAEHLEAMKSANVVWLEWGNQLAEYLSRQQESLAGKQTIVRIHSYEVLDRLADKIDFSHITDVVFVSRLVRDIFRERSPETAGARTHVIHNSIDLKRFSLVPRNSSRRSLAFLGLISHKKDPMVLMQAFAFLHRRHPEITLHIGGPFQDQRYELAMTHFVKEAGLSEAATFYGRIEKPEDWLRDKDFIFCSSPFESQGVGLLEAMSRGCRPLIRNFPGARDLYRDNQLWTSFDDLDELFMNGPEPEEVSAFVAEYYGRDRETAAYLKIIQDKEIVDEIFNLQGD